MGDLSFAEGWTQKLWELPGRKILIRGNHDRLPMEVYLDAGWLPMESMVLKLTGLRIVFSHRPMIGHAYDINIHGHQHDPLCWTIRGSICLWRWNIRVTLLLR